jgi:hypothetical protein
MSAAARALISAKLKGKHHPHKGHAMSSAARAKIAAKLKGKKHPHKGHPISSAARAKIAAKLKGKKHPHKGHPMSSAARAKIAAKLKGKFHGKPAMHPTRPRPAGGVRRHMTRTAPHRVRGHVPRRSPYRVISTSMHVHHHNITRRRIRRHGIVIHRRVHANRVWRKRRRRG